MAQCGATVLMIDCGLTLRETERRLARLGLAPAQVTAILVTHEHDDHGGRAFDFAAAHGVAVYLTHGTAEAMRQDGKVLEGVKLEHVSGMRKLAVGDIEVQPFTVPHDAREPVQYVLSDGAARLGVLTDIGASTVHVEQVLCGVEALVLECNYDAAMLAAGAYPKWLKERVAGPFGHLDNAQAERLLGALERSRLKHVIGAHLSQQNNRPELARAALSRALGCEESWIGLATQDDGFDWRTL